MIKYSIIIPTYNGSSKLKKCLEHITDLRRPQHGFEVIVIDNGSTDDTAQIAKSYDFVRYFYDKTPGLHTGRHLGAKEAKGEILCYIDDDSFVDKNWLIEIEKTFSETEVVLAGGSDLPHYEKRPPSWLKYFWIDSPWGKWLGQLSLIEFYNKEMKAPAWFVFGCNFIIKKQTMFENGGFNPDGMPQHIIKYRGDGETALSCKLNQKGFVAHINPKIKIYHYVPKSRMTVEYFKKRAYNQGVSDSFTQIKKENGFDYSDFIPNDNVDKIRAPFFERKFNKLLKPKIEKFLQKFDPQYKIYLDIKKEYEISYKEGFNFHQNEVKNDPELLKWVLKENYLEDYDKEHNA